MNLYSKLPRQPRDRTAGRQTRMQSGIKSSSLLYEQWGRWMAGAIVSEHWSTWMTQSVSTLARINSHGYHLLQKQTQQHIRSNKLTSVSGKICSLFQPFWLLATSINLLPAFVSWQIAPLSTSPACSLSIPPQSLPYAHLCPTVIFFTLCILLFSSIYFFLRFLFCITHSQFQQFHLPQLYLSTFPCRVTGFSSVLQGTTSNSCWVCPRPHSLTWRLMILLSKTEPRLNIDHQASVPRALREAICQGDNLFCSPRYGVPGTRLFFLHVVLGPDRHHYRAIICSMKHAEL